MPHNYVDCEYALSLGGPDMQLLCIREGGPCRCNLPRPPATRNSYATRTVSAWTGKRMHKCDSCHKDFASEYAAAFHQCAGPTTGRVKPTVPIQLEFRIGEDGRVWEKASVPSDLPPGAYEASIEAVDYSALELRVMASMTGSQARCKSCGAKSLFYGCYCGTKWDAWKAHRDVA